MLAWMGQTPDHDVDVPYLAGKRVETGRGVFPTAIKA